MRNLQFGVRFAIAIRRVLSCLDPFRHTGSAMEPVRKALLKWIASIAFVGIVILIMAVAGNESLLIVLALILFFLALPMSILLTIEAGRTLRDAPELPRSLRVLGFILSIPQALLGFVSAAIGVAIILWVAYNLLVERQPQFTGSGWSLGIGPVLAVVGYWWMRSAFRRTRSRQRSVED